MRKSSCVIFFLGCSFTSFVFIFSNKKARCVFKMIKLGHNSVKGCNGYLLLMPPDYCGLIWICGATIYRIPWWARGESNSHGITPKAPWTFASACSATRPNAGLSPAVNVKIHDLNASRRSGPQGNRTLMPKAARFELAVSTVAPMGQMPRRTGAH